MKTANALDYQGGGLLGDLSVGGEMTILGLIAVTFFIVGVLLGRLSVAHEAQVDSEPTAQNVYGRFGHTSDAPPVVAPAAAAKVR